MVGSTILHYEILELLGKGAMGAVYKARDTRLDTMRALKFLHIQLANRDVASAHFIREARTQAKLMHPNIAALLALEITDDSSFLVMEYVDGIPLDDYLEQENPSTRERIGILMQVANALNAAHVQGIIHRDIKPTNVLVGRDGTVKVTDFGLAKAIGQTELSRTGETKGSAFYMPPEAFKGGIITEAADVWALGVLTYQVLEGHPPFKGEVFEAIAYQIIQESHPAPSKKHCDELPGIELFLDRCLEKDPEKRTETGQAAFQELTEIARAAGFEELLKLTAPAITKKPERRIGRLGYAVAGVIALLVVAGLLLGRRPVPTAPVRLMEQSALANESDPSWNPDGSRFAYLQGIGNDSKTLVIHTAQAGVSPVMEDLPPELELGFIDWSPDEDMVAISGGSGVFLYHLVTKEIIQVKESFVQHVSWSSDGRWLVWGNTQVEASCLERVGPVEQGKFSEFREYTPQQIDLGDVTGFDASTSFYSPVYILGDTKIAFVASRLGENLGIWILDLEGGEVEQILPGEPHLAWDLVWDDRKNRLFFREDMGRDVFQVPLDKNGRCQGDVLQIDLEEDVSGFDYDPGTNRLVLLTSVDSHYIWEAPLKPVPGEFSPLITDYYQTITPVFWESRNALLFTAVETERGVHLQTFDLNSGEISDLHPPSDQYGNEYSPTIDPIENRFVVFLGMIGNKDTGLLYYDSQLGQIGELLETPGEGTYGSPHWSGDGEYIFLSFRYSDEKRDMEIRRLRVVRSSSGIRAGKIDTVLTRKGIASPRVSADGKFLLFTSAREDTHFLDVIDLNTGEIKELIEGQFAALDPTRRDLYYMYGTSVWKISNWSEYFGRQPAPEKVVDLPRGVVSMGLTNSMCVSDTALYAILWRLEVGGLKVYQLPE